MDKQFCPYCMTPVKPGESCPVCGLTAGSYVPEPHHLPPGTVLLGRYQVGRVLGEGGFGITYIGCDLRLELKVAIKEYFPVDRASRNSEAGFTVTSFIGPAAKSYERGKQKFLEEARVMARMDKQQTIVGVRDFFETNNTAYIVMEFVEGTTFRNLVEQRGGRIPAGELFAMIEPLFAAMTSIHKKGLIHRDISPDNLMLENGIVRLLDFGCARETGDARNETLTITLKHGYAPLEQYQQKGQGPWTDIYALCATIYYCLVGIKPPQALDRIGEDGLLLPTKMGADITEKQEKALLKGLALRVADRYQTMEELHEALYGTPEPEADEEPRGQANRQTRADSGTALTEAAEASGAEEETGDALAEQTVSVAGTEPVLMSADEKSADEPKPDGHLDRLPGSLRRFLPWAAGGIAALILLLVWILAGPKSSVQETQAVLEETAGGAAGAASGAHNSTQDENGEREIRNLELRQSFADAQTAGTIDELCSLMEDPGCTAVILKEGVRLIADEASARDLAEGGSAGAAAGEDSPAEAGSVSGIVPLTVRKPLLIPKNSSLCATELTVEGDGRILADGELSVAGYLGLMGDGCRLYRAETGKLNMNEEALLYMDTADGLEDWDGRALSEQAKHLIVKPANRRVVTVNSEDELEEWTNEDAEIHVQSDLVLSKVFSIPGTLIIEEGVSVTLADAGYQ